MMVLYQVEAADETIVHYFNDVESARGEALILSELCPNIEATVSRVQFERNTRRQVLAILNRANDAFLITTIAIYLNGNWTDS